MADEPPVPPFEPTGPAYLYEQLADHLAARMLSGHLPVGARLPGERDLASEYGVSIDSARRAVEELRRRGLLVTLPTEGTFVAEPGAGEGPADD
ncbi:MAG: transcriptional regulator, GntR family [Streptosporangiaceae bacterium]|jgi:GntR family transcriptional regulator|nr:transcriptional regulator, GntR family [Streptosporangiaceae bacterium]